MAQVDLGDYKSAFATERLDDEFISYCTKSDSPTGLAVTTLTRREFLSMVDNMLRVLQEHELKLGDHICHYFQNNTVQDLACRLAASVLGCVPVTINWSSDNLQRVQYKLQTTNCKLLIYGIGVNETIITQLVAATGVVAVKSNSISEAALNPICDGNMTTERTKIVIFTSGTTGNPKGVNLSFGNYKVNALTFHQFLQIQPSIRLCAVVVNPVCCSVFLHVIVVLCCVVLLHKRYMTLY